MNQVTFEMQTAITLRTLCMQALAREDAAFVAAQTAPTELERFTHELEYREACDACRMAYRLRYDFVNMVNDPMISNIAFDVSHLLQSENA